MSLTDNDLINVTIECSSCPWIGRRKFPKRYLLNPALFSSNSKDCPKCGEAVQLRYPFKIRSHGLNVYIARP